MSEEKFAVTVVLSCSKFPFISHFKLFLRCQWESKPEMRVVLSYGTEWPFAWLAVSLIRLVGFGFGLNDVRRANGFELLTCLISVIP